jgi:hypothetical protein
MRAKPDTVCCFRVRLSTSIEKAEVDCGRVCYLPPGDGSAEDPGGIRPGFLRPVPRGSDSAQWVGCRRSAVDRKVRETMVRWILVPGLFLCCSAGAQQAAVTLPDEPPNLAGVKEQLKHYQSCIESNCYGPQLERQADLAIGFLNQSALAEKPGEKLAIVLDIDETSLSNWGGRDPR